MKRYVLLSVFICGSIFAQTVSYNGSICTKPRYNKLTFTFGMTHKVISFSCSGDTLRVESELPLDSAAVMFFKYLDFYLVTPLDSITVLNKRLDAAYKTIDLLSCKIEEERRKYKRLVESIAANTKD